MAELQLGDKFGIESNLKNNGQASRNGKKIETVLGFLDDDEGLPTDSQVLEKVGEPSPFQ